MGLVLLPETVPEKVTKVAENVFRTVPGNEVHLAMELRNPALETQLAESSSRRQTETVVGRTSSFMVEG